MVIQFSSSHTLVTRLKNDTWLEALLNELAVDTIIESNYELMKILQSLRTLQLQF